MKLSDLYAAIALSVIGTAVLLACGYTSLSVLMMPTVVVFLSFAGFFAWVWIDKRMGRRVRIAIRSIQR